MSSSPDRPASGPEYQQGAGQGSDPGFQQGTGQGSGYQQDAGYEDTSYQQGTGQDAGYQQGYQEGAGQGSGYQQGSDQGTGSGQEGRRQRSSSRQRGGTGTRTREEDAGYQQGSGYQQDTGSRQGSSYPQGRQDTWTERGAPARHGAERKGAEIAGTVLAGTLMLISGFFAIVMGIVVLSTHHIYVHTAPAGYTYRWTLHGWGWAELIFGIVLVAAGTCVFLGMAWARWLGVVLAVISAVGNFMFLPFTPVWSGLMIALSVFIIWALSRPRHYPGEI